MINSHKISQFQRLSLHMSWLCRKYHVILRLKTSSFEHLSKYKMLSNPFMTCFWLEACTPPLHQSLKHTLIFKQFKHANQAFGQKNFQSFIRPLEEAPQEVSKSVVLVKICCFSVSKKRLISQSAFQKKFRIQDIRSQKCE